MKATLQEHSNWFHAVLMFTAYRIWAYWLKRTEIIAANSTAELLRWGYKRLFRKEKNVMFSKVIPLGDAGSLTVSESGGVAKLAISVGASLGGGSVAGVLKASVGAEIDLGAQQLVDLGLEMAMAKFPAVAPLIAAAKSAIDLELSKV